MNQLNVGSLMPVFSTSAPTERGSARQLTAAVLGREGRFRVATLLLLALAVGPLRIAMAAGEPVVIVNPEVPTTNLGANALRAIFGMRLRAWPDGSAARVYVLKDDSQTHVQFAKQQLSIFPHQLRRAWDRLVYSGTGQAPRTVDSEAEMIAQVASTPGAIGYVSEEMVNDNVRVVDIR